MQWLARSGTKVLHFLLCPSAPALAQLPSGAEGHSTPGSTPHTNLSVLFSQVHVLPIKIFKRRGNQVVGLRTHFYFLICLLLKTETLSPPQTFGFCM